MPAPKTFATATPDKEPYELTDEGLVIIYRFGNQAVDRDWLSRRRQAEHGNNYDKPPDSELNNFALEQTSYGREAANIAGNPFLSVATSQAQLFTNSEGWVQKILTQVPTVGTFAIPQTSLYRPSPTKPLSKGETEWLYLDCDAAITAHLIRWLPNPYRRDA